MRKYSVTIQFWNGAAHLRMKNIVAIAAFYPGVNEMLMPGFPRPFPY